MSGGITGSFSRVLHRTGRIQCVSPTTSVRQEDEGTGRPGGAL